MHTTNALLAGLLIAFCAPGLTSCQSEGYASSLALSGAEHQRDLTRKVDAVLEVQTASQAEFASAFDVLLSLQGATAEEVEGLYKKLQLQVDSCARSVERVDLHIGRVEEGSALLFAAWETELEQFSSPAMRARSEARMGEARQGLQHLLERLRDARGSMDGILRTQRDFVLYFNHNLSPNSVATLEPENRKFKASMQELNGLIERAREQAQTFMGELQGAPVETDA